VQADARLVKYIKDAHQPRADLRGQPDALGLAAAQRAAFAVQRQITQADVFEKAQAGANFLDQSAAIFC
jgi:hypothetical protein